MIDVKKRIKEVMAKYSWSLYDLAMNADISESTVYAWYKEGSVPSLWNIKKICDAAEITLERFFCGDTYASEEGELLGKWSLLTSAEKETVMNVMRAINRYKNRTV